MRKILALILVCATLLSMCMLPISAADITPSSTGQAATSVVGKPMVIDGEMGADEGWGEAVGILNKYRNISGDAAVKERGKVYVSYDESYVYCFVEIAAEFVNRDESYLASNWTCTVKTDFGATIGVQEVGVNGADATSGFNNNSIASNIKNQEWTTDAVKNEVTFYCKKDETYRVEWKFPIPEAAQSAMRAGDFELKVSVYQGIGKGATDSKAGGVFMSDAVDAQTDLTKVRNYSIGVTLPKLMTNADANEADFPTVHDVSDKAVLIDGYDYECWADLDYSLLGYSFGTEGAVVPKESQSRVRVGTDGQYMYVYYETSRVNHGTSPVVYIYMNFPHQGGTKRITTYVGGTNVGKTHTNEFGTSAAYAVVEGINTTVLEVRVEIPEADRETLKTTAITNAWINIIERYDISTGAANTGMSSSSESTWNATTQYTIPQIDPIENAMVKQIAGKTVSINGVKDDANEGWAETPYMRLDYVKGTTYYSKPSELYLSTDGEYLYAFFKSYKENWGINNNCQFYFYIMFETEENPIQVRFNFVEGNETAPTYYQYSATETLDKTQVTTQIVRGADSATLEFKLPIPDSNKEILESRPANIKIGVFEKEVSWGGNNGKAPSEGSSFDATIFATIPADPIADNESRVVGVQWRENPENTETRDVRFLAAIGDYKSYEGLGFSFTLEGAPGEGGCDVVYSSIVADGSIRYAETYGGKYFFAYTLKGLEKGKTYNFTATSYTQKSGADSINGNTLTVTVTVAADGEVTFS